MAEEGTNECGCTSVFFSGIIIGMILMFLLNTIILLCQKQKELRKAQI